jgi:hypothetical protein
MKTPWRTLFPGLLIALVVTASAQACTCVKKSASPEDYFSRATFVFVGRVVSAEEISSRKSEPRLSGVKANFRLIQEIKGKVSPLFAVETGYGAGDCGYPVAIGQTYIFFTGPQGEISICGGTQRYLEGYEPDEAVLREIKKLGKRG